MLLKVSYIILFSLSWALSFAQVKEFWYPESVQEHQIASFAGDDADGNLWLISTQNILLKKSQSGEITEYEIPEIENAIVNGFVSRDGNIYLSYIDVGYRTTFFWGNPKVGWNQLKGIFPNAIRRFLETRDGIIYAYGDWGSSLELDNTSNTYQRIPFPYVQHIRTVREMNDMLYLGVRNVGLVKYDGDQSIVFEGSGNISSDIDDILQNESGIPPSFVTMRGRYYKWQNDTYHLTAKAPIGRSATKGTFYKTDPYFAGAYGQVYSFRNGEWKTSNLPANSDIQAFHLDKDSSLFALDMNGRLYKLRLSGELLFTNYTRQEAMIGNSLDKSMSVQTVDINNDGLLDITVNSSGINNRINIFIQYENGRYREESARFFDDYPMEIEKIWFQDFSLDGKADLMVMYNKESEFHINTYFQFQKKFILHQNISIHSDSLQELKDFVISDIDGDEDEDVLLAFYYAEGRQKGAISLLENVGHGKFELHTNVNSGYRHWANSLWAGDLNDDGIHEVIVGTYWSDDLIISGDLTGSEQKIYYLPDSTNTTGILTADITRNGKPELIRNSWEFGIQVFAVQPDLSFNLLQGFYQDRAESVQSISLVDINSDGWIDAIVSGQSESQPFSHFLINREGKLVQNNSTEFGFKELVDQNLIPVDFDGDGDLDIIALRDGENKIFENHKNPQNVIRIHHNSEAGHAEQWRINQADTVVWAHHKNISGIGNGSSEFLLGVHSLDEISIETGDNTEFEYQMQEQEGGNQLLIAPKESAWEKLSKLMYHLLIVLHIPAFYFYIMTILAGTLVLILTYYVGAKKLDWEWKSLVTITLANSTLFWMLLVLSGNLGEFWRYGIPLGGVVAGSILPVVFSTQNRLFRASQSEEQAKLEILDLMLRFTHGAWSNSVINRFNMLLVNVSYEGNREIMEQLQERKRSFQNIVLPELREIHSLMVIANYNKLQIQMLSDSITYFENTLGNGDQNLIRDAEKISKKLEDLRNVIRAVRNTTWQHFSCDMIEVVQQVTDLHKDRFLVNNIEIERRTDGSTEAWVLTPPARMAEIIDNIILNAVKAMKENSDNYMSFFIYHKAPKWVLEISDTGTGIQPDLHEKIFESGFSKHQSSGQGLYKSRESLKQFGGRISVQKSTMKEGTVFKIECLEGAAP